jgi:membrane associated rhomboid family serine protease/Tfp pilus assembly protein PilF
MAIRVLGVIIGALALAVPFLGKASFLDTLKSNPGLLLGLPMGIVFIAYGLGGPRFLAKLRLPLTKPVTEGMSKSQPMRADPDFQQRLERVTPKVYVTYVLIALNVLVFAAMVAAGAGFFTPNPKVHLQWGSNFGPLTTHGEWWRLVTCTFVHFGVLHLAFNMWALYENGRIVERLYGNLYFLAVYLFAGITGSLTSVFWHPMVNSAGASGAIFGVLGALLAFTVVMHQSIPFAVRKAQRNSTIVFILYALTSGFTATGVDNAAHLGGLAGGFLAGLALARPLDPEQRRSGGVRRIVSAAVLVLAAAVVLVPLFRHSADTTAYIVHGALEMQTGDFDGAIADLSRAIELDPKRPEAYLARGAAKAGKRDVDAAIADYSLALEVDPKSFRAYTVRGEARGAKGDSQGAIADLSRAIEINPRAQEAYNDLAWALATTEPPAMRDGRRAVELALRACELSQWKTPAYIDTLAAAYARNGDFFKAVEWQRKAMADPKLQGSDKAQERLRLYQANKAWPPD